MTILVATVSAFALAMPAMANCGVRFFSINLRMPVIVAAGEVSGPRPPFLAEMQVLGTDEQVACAEQALQRSGK